MRCPECGSKMIYNKDTRTYTCTGCGLVLSREKLEEIRDSIFSNLEEVHKKDKAKEYLEWWIGELEE